MEQIREQEEEEAEMNRADACTMTDGAQPLGPSFDQGVQTDNVEPVVKEVIKTVEVVREVHIREDQGKVDDIEIAVDI